MKKALLILIIAILGFSLISVPAGVKKVFAVPSQNVKVFAAFSGWNVTTGPTTNPAFTEFRGLSFTVNVEHDDTPGISHNFAIYTKGTQPSAVFTSQTCSPPGTAGCWARSGTVTASSFLSSVTFSPLVPPDDFSGAGGYEYFCQFHPISMHGKITVYKNVDTNGDSMVSILDVANVAFYFGQTVTAGSPAAVKAVDFNNDGIVTILDVALSAFYFGKSFV